MNSSNLLKSRSDKEIFLKEIISRLSISESEKDIYFLSLEILDDVDFDIFFQKINSQLEKNSKNFSIEPFTTKLI